LLFIVKDTYSFIFLLYSYAILKITKAVAGERGKSLESIIYFLILLVLIIGYFVVKYTLPQFAQKIVDSRFDKKLETHKHELNKLTEEAKFNYQRLLSDFNLYSVKKHEHYIQIYNSLIIAHGSVFYLASSLKQLSTYDFFNEQDMDEHLNKIGTPRGRTDELIGIWKTDKKSGIKEIQKHETYLEEWKVERDVDKLNNTYWGSQLNLSGDLKELLKTLIADLRTLSINAKREYQPISGNISGEDYMKLYEENKKSKAIINENMEKITAKMQNELSVGYYKT